MIYNDKYRYINRVPILTMFSFVDNNEWILCFIIYKEFTQAKNQKYLFYQLSLIFGRIFLPCSIDYCRNTSKVTLKITNDPVYKFDDITVADSDSILCPFLESKLKLKKVVQMLYHFDVVAKTATTNKKTMLAKSYVNTQKQSELLID